MSTTRGCPSGGLAPWSRSARAIIPEPSRARSSASGAAERVDVGLLGEVEVRFQVGQHVEQAVAECGDRARPGRRLTAAGRRRAGRGV